MGLEIFRQCDRAKQSRSGIVNELEEETAPGRMVFQAVIVLRSENAQPRQIIPGNGREIMMFVVVAHVQANTIYRSVVTVGLLVRIVRVMFLDPASANRVQ